MNKSNKSSNMKFEYLCYILSYTCIIRVEIEQFHLSLSHAVSIFYKSSCSEYRIIDRQTNIWILMRPVTANATVATPDHGWSLY